VGVRKGLLIGVGLVGAFIFAPLVSLYLAVLFVRRRRSGKPGFPALPLFTRPGRIVFCTVAWGGLTLVTISFAAATISTSTDEHVAPVLGAFTIFALIAIAATDVVTQGLLAAARMSWRTLGHR